MVMLAGEEHPSPRPLIEELRDMELSEIYDIIKPALTEEERAYFEGPNGKESLERIRQHAMSLLAEPGKTITDAIIEAAGKRINIGETPGLVVTTYSDGTADVRQMNPGESIEKVHMQRVKDRRGGLD